MNLVSDHDLATTLVSLFLYFVTLISDLHYAKDHRNQLKNPPPDGVHGIMCFHCPKVFDRWDLEEHHKSVHWGRIPVQKFYDIKSGKVV